MSTLRPSTKQWHTSIWKAKTSSKHRSLASNLLTLYWLNNNGLLTRQLLAKILTSLDWHHTATHYRTRSQSIIIKDSQYYALPVPDPLLKFKTAANCQQYKTSLRQTLIIKPSPSLLTSQGTMPMPSNIHRLTEVIVFRMPYYESCELCQKIVSFFTLHSHCIWPN